MSNNHDNNKNNNKNNGKTLDYFTIQSALLKAPHMSGKTPQQKAREIDEYFAAIREKQRQHGGLISIEEAIRQLDIDIKRDRGDNRLF
jgi:hypothetical protein